MTRTKLRPALTFGVLALCSLLALPACNDDDAAAELQASVDGLQKSLLEAKKDRERLVAKIERLERRVEGYAQDIDRLQHRGITGLASATVATDAGEPGDAAVGGDPSTSGVPAALEQLLETDTGREAIAKTMEQIQEKRDAERRSRMVEGMIDRFAEQADLTPEQTDRLAEVMGKRFERMREIWSAMRAPDAPREERAVVREQAMAQMEELRAQTDDEVKAILNGDQYAIYQEQAGRFGGWGGGRDGGGRGR